MKDTKTKHPERMKPEMKNAEMKNAEIMKNTEDRTPRRKVQGKNEGELIDAFISMDGMQHAACCCWRGEGWWLESGWFGGGKVVTLCIHRYRYI